MNPQKKKKKGDERVFQQWQERMRLEFEAAGGGRRGGSICILSKCECSCDVARCDAILCAPTVGQGMFRGYITLDFRGTQLLPPSISRSLSRSVCLGWVHWSRASTDGRQRSTHGPHRWAGRGGCRRVKVTERAGADVNMIQRMDKLW